MAAFRTNHTVPSGTGCLWTPFPGISCQATFERSLRDVLRRSSTKSHPLAPSSSPPCVPTTTRYLLPETANENRTPDEGLSYCVFDGKRFTLAAAIQERGAQIIGESIWNKYRRWPVYSKFFDNMGPIPHHMHQSAEFARLVGQEGKPESYYFPPQHNQVGNNFPYTFMGLEPGTTKDQVKKCLENWNLGDNGILDLSKAYRLKPGTGWLIGPGLLHAPGSLVTYEPQWGSDVFSMFQSLVEGREVPRALLVKDMPPETHFHLDFIVSEPDGEASVSPSLTH